MIEKCTNKKNMKHKIYRKVKICKNDPLRAIKRKRRLNIECLQGF